VNELKDGTQLRLNYVIVLSIGAAFLIYITVACSGYSTYGNEVASNILVSYPSKYAL
jgi:amino acid permease